MADQVEGQLLELDQLRADAVSGMPPVIRVEVRVARGPDGHPHRLASHGAVELPAQPSRMITRAHHDYRPNRMLAAPIGKHTNLGSRPCPRPRYALYIAYAEHPELPDLRGGSVLVRNAPFQKLLIDSVWRVGEHGHSRGQTPSEQIDCLQHAGRPCLTADHDDVGRFDGLIDDQGPSRGSQNRLSHRHNPDQEGDA